MPCQHATGRCVPVTGESRLGREEARGVVELRADGVSSPGKSRTARQPRAAY
jgi:hypothetical protein